MRLNKTAMTSYKVISWHMKAKHDLNQESHVAADIRTWHLPTWSHVTMTSFIWRRGTNNKLKVHTKIAGINKVYISWWQWNGKDAEGNNPSQIESAKPYTAVRQESDWSKVSGLCYTEQAWMRETAQWKTDTARLRQHRRFGRSNANRICVTRTGASRRWVSTWSVTGSSNIIWTSSHWNLIGHCMSFPLPMLSPSSTPPPISYHSRKVKLDVLSKNVSISIFSYFLKLYNYEIDYYEATYGERCIRFIHTASFDNVVMRYSVQKTRCLYITISTVNTQHI